MYAKVTVAASVLVLAIVYSVTGSITNGSGSETAGTSKVKKKKKFPPGPSGYPYVGVHFSIDQSKLHLHFLEWAQQYGEIFMTKVLGKNVVVINSPQLLRKAFNTEEFTTLLNDRPLNFVGDVVLYGYKDVLLRRYDDSFRKMKTLLWQCMDKHGFRNPHFHSLAQMEFRSVVQQFSDTNGEPINPNDILLSSYCAVIGMFFFGKRLTADDRIVQCIKNIDRDGDIMIRPEVHVVYKKFPWIRKLCGYYGNLYRSVVGERDVLMEAVRDIQNSNEEGKGQGLIHGLFDSGADWLTDEHVNGMLMDLINTSTLTTKSMMAGFIFLWLHYPEMQKKIRAEIEQVIGAERDPEIKDVMEMPYTRACMYETYRYHSNLPFTAPHSNLDHEVEIDGVTIPQESIIFGNLFSIHHDENLWDEPWKFKPERYLQDGNFVPGDHECMTNNLAFGVGERKCLGKDIAFYRMFQYTVHLLRSFEFLCTDGAELSSVDPRQMVLESPVLIPPEYKCRVVPITDINP